MLSLPLHLHEQYGRKEVFATVGISYTSQQQHLNTGLSPRLPGGGYFIFITLQKDDLDPAYDYDDELFSGKFRWVTRRDRNENHPDYVNLRNPKMRVSLFVRHDARTAKFSYLGEVIYQTHRQFQRSGHVQQEYMFNLVRAVPEDLLASLTAGKSRSTGSAPAPRSHPAAKMRNRRPSNLDEYKRAFSYVLGELDRSVSPDHYNYQVRLKRYLASKGVTAEFEKDFVDVRFSAGGTDFIGEVKVTGGWLRVEQAFRAALGQLLDYAHTRCEKPVSLIMFLDKELDTKRLELADKLGIAIISEIGDCYLVHGSKAVQSLKRIFPG